MWEYKYTPGKKEHEFNIMSAEIIADHCKHPNVSMELGAGTGQLSLLLLKKNPEMFAYMVDQSESAIDYIKHYYYGDCGLLNGIRYNACQINIEELIMCPEYDLVFSSGLIEHFKGSKQGYICELHKKMSLQYVVCIVPNATEENIAIAQTEKHKKLYGYEKPMTEKELDNLFVDDTFKKVHGQTFYKNNKLLIGVYKK